MLKIKLLTNKNTSFRLLRSRRGEDMLVDFWAILAFAIVLIIFFIIFNATKHQSTQNTLVDFRNKDVGFMLDSFIRAPYYKDKQKSIGDIIIEDYMKKDYSRTKDSFKEFFSGTNNYGGYVIDSITVCIFENDGFLKAYKFSRTQTALNPKVDPIYDFSEEKEMKCDSSIASRSEVLVPKIDNGNLKIKLEIVPNAIITFVQT